MHNRKEVIKVPTPKENEAKINQTVSAWKTLRPVKSFAGMTLDQFATKVKPSLDARNTVAALEDQLSAAINARSDADKTSLQNISLVVNAVKGDLEEGEDSALYEALGYVRKSERKSGLKRSRKAPVPA